MNINESKVYTCNVIKVVKAGLTQG